MRRWGSLQENYNCESETIVAIISEILILIKQITKDSAIDKALTLKQVTVIVTIQYISL